MEQFSKKITSYLIRNNVIKEEKACIYQYGFQVGFEVCLNTVISILIAVACKMEVEAIVFFCVFTLLRSYAGGLHLDTYLSCLICSCSSFLIILLLIKYLSVSKSVCGLIITISFICIKALAPVPDVNRPLGEKEERQFEKKLGYSLLAIGLFSIGCYISGYERLLLTVALTSLFMVFIMILGKVKYQISIEKNQ